MTELKQLDGIDLKYIKEFRKNNINGFAEAKYLSQLQLEYFLGIDPGAGENIVQGLHSLPKLNIKATLASNKVRTDLETLEISLIISIGIDNMGSDNPKIRHNFINTIIGLSTGELIDIKRFTMLDLIEGNINSFRLTANVTDYQQKIHCHIFCENVLNIDASYVLSLDTIEEWKFDNLMDEKSKYESEYNSTTIKETDNDLTQYVRSDSESDLDCDDLILDPVKSIRSAVGVSRDKSNSRDSTSKLNSIRKLRLDGNYECNHLCKDKTKCRHFCCRDGIPKVKKQRNTNNHIEIESNNCDSKVAASFASVDSSQVAKTQSSRPNDPSTQSQDHLPLLSLKRKKIQLGRRVGIFNLTNEGLFDF